MEPPMSFLEALPTTNVSCACIVEYSDSCTTAQHGCHSHLWTTNYPATNDYFPRIIISNATCWLDIYCCIPAASLPTTKKKGVVQSKALWEKDYSSFFDC